MEAKRVAREVGIVVPCFDEAARLNTEAFRAAHLPHVRFLFVDDGSSDDTPQRLADLAASDPTRFAKLRLHRNGGKAEAVRAGMLLLLDDPTLTVLGFWDADLATPLDALPEMLAVLQDHPEVEMVLGSRVKILGRHIDRRPARHYFGRGAAFLVSNLLDMDVYDTQCGAKLFRRTAHTPTLFDAPFTTRWAFDVEVLARWLGARPEVQREQMGRYLVEHPLRTWYDVRGSKLTAGDFLGAPWDLLRIWLRYRTHIRRQAPR